MGKYFFESVLVCQNTPLHTTVFGKTMENLTKTISVKLIDNFKDYVRYVSKPNFILEKIFCKNFVAIHQKKKRF